MDKMKSVGSDLKEKLSATKKRVKELEDETSSLKESLAATQARLTKLEGFAAGHSEVSEDELIFLSIDSPVDGSRNPVLEVFREHPTVVMNVSAYLDELLPKDQRHPIQCSRRKYEADFEPAIDDDDWKLFEFPKPDHTTAEISTNEKSQPTIALTVFPCLSVLEQQASTAYTSAIRLSSLQYQWIAAQREMAKDPTTNPSIGRAFSCLRKSSNSKSLPSVDGGPKKRNGS
ncbi:hypothetical protein BDV33DRAFT_210430 [Aspergillus novoparasiticus]|uniref:Uncharacterized protein n=1 Tax=Aspergillus novoparasiticus TaxID=986946 RepID=A0A5N6E7X6_9EURO|nr:hypothetical protein BDV33DRAFT_210430 [Aspergillus novoparasiticus]